MHNVNSILRNKQIHLHAASALQKYNQGLVLCSRAAFEEVMSAKQQKTWAFSTQVVLLAVYSMFHKLCRLIGRVTRVKYSLESLSIF